MNLQDQVCYRKLRNGGYHAIHKWLIKHFGKANICENDNCKKISKNFQWAKKKECFYEHKRENFIKLCSSCHSIYDYTEERKYKIGIKSKGRKKTIESKLKTSLSCKGIHRGNKHSAKSIIQKDLDGNNIKIWDCITDADIKLNMSPSGITMCAKGQLHKSGGFKWSYLSK